MLYPKERELIVAYGKKLIESKLTTGTSGNISIYLPDKKQLLITPSGMDYAKIQQEDIIVMDLCGNVVEGNKKPSSEYLMHQIFYRRRNDIRALVHVHSVYATTLASINSEIPAVHYLVATAGGGNVRCAKYATYGTKELAENAYQAMENRYAVLLANHGLLTGSKDLPQAFSIALEIEFCAEIYYRTKTLGNPVILTAEEMANVLGRFKKE
jgi:L-fuculose-phosphate aldolase